MNNNSVVRLVTIDLSFHRAASGVIRSILAKHQISVVETVLPHEMAFEQLRAGTADVLCSAWLPDSHGIYFDPMADQFEKLTVLYRPYAFWGVPDYVPADAVMTIDDLRKPEVVDRMQLLIQGIGPGAGISRFSRTAIGEYKLAELGYHFENGTLDQCVAAFETAVCSEQWIVVPIWKPQFLHEKHSIRELKDPRKVMGGADEATLLMRRRLMERLPDAAITALRNTYLGNKTVSRLDYLVSREKMLPIDAALIVRASLG